MGRRTDVYSFAVSVLEMFTGGISWMSGAAAGAALTVRRERSEPGIPELPTELADLLERGLRMDPSARPASMAEVATELVEIYRRVIGTPYPRSAPVAADLRADELNNRGLSLLDLGRPAEATEAFAAALVADPQHLHATYNTGLLRWRRGEHTDEDLIATLDATIASGADPDEARRLLAEVHRERGDHDQADALLGREPTVRSSGTRRIPWYVYEDRVETFFDMRIRRQPPTMHVRFTRDGTRAVTACDGVLRAWSVHDGRCLRELAAPTVEFKFDISDDGRYAITAGPSAVQFWDLAEGRCLRVFDAPEDWNRSLWSASVCLSGDGRVAVSANYDGTVLVRDFPSGRLRLTLDGHNSNANAAISHDGRFVLTAGREDGTARLWEVATGRCVRVFDGYILDGYKGVDTLHLSADGHLVVLAAGGRIRVWDIHSGRTHTLDGHTRVVGSVSVSDRFVVSTSADDTLRLWALDSGRCLRTFRGDSGPVRAGHLDAAAGVLQSAWQADLLRWWAVPARYTAPLRLSRPREHDELSRLDTRVADLMNRARLATDPRAALELLAEARAVSGYEREPRLLAAWREVGRSAVRVGLRSAWPGRVFDLSTGNFALELNADDRIAVSGGGDGTVRVWDVDSGTCLRVIAKHPSLVNAVGVSDDGSRAMSASRDGTIAAWSVETGERISVLDRPLALGATAAAFDRAGQLALVAGADSVIRLWNLDTGACEREMPGHAQRISALWLGPDLTASAGSDGVVRLWDLETGQCLRTLHGHTHSVMSVCLSPDGRHALSAGGYTDRTIRWWDTATGECLRVFGDEPDNPRAVDSVPKVQSKKVRFSPDGRFALSGGSDATVRIWELATGRCLRVLDGHNGEVSAVVISSDAQFVLSASWDGTIRRWELDWDLRAP
ncbi:WD40 repeat domain-containing serine/threonine-protein kinase [Saccharopolyspora soli]|uniref:WD40 repeat domain-containing serine/threonine-protein kinase n=1 Tax=Saccharopolyspora soli TaxID=2926618 RepID=UPI0027E1BAA1|nr:WD40 repeat domain-containing serine/threonine-protein kinase [Saccharopolyspora soli]